MGGPIDLAGPTDASLPLVVGKRVGGTTQSSRERDRPTRRRDRTAILAVCASFLIGISCPDKAQAEPPSTAFSTSSSEWEGYSEFVLLAQRTLGTSRVRPSAELDYSALRPQDAVIIVHPTRSLDEASLSAFLADGGRVALLDDFGKGAPLLQKFNIRRSSPPSNPEKRLRDNPDLAVAVPSVQVVAGAERGRHPMAEHVENVVTNHPVVLRHPDLTPVLEIRDQNGSAEALAVTGVIAKRGRLFALGDPSVFINLMLRYPGNRNLAEGMLDYLANRNDSPGALPESAAPGSVTAEAARVSKVWIVTGSFEQTGSYGQPDSFLDHLRQKLADVAQALSSIDDEGLPPLLATALAALLAIWALGTQLRGDLVLPRLSGQSFARTPILAAQTGLGARADILSSRKANPILALMELDGAIRETIARRLGINPSGSQAELSQALSSAGLSGDDARSLARILSELRGFGQSLSQGKPKRPTDESLKQYHVQSMKLLSEIERLGKKQ